MIYNVAVVKRFFTKFQVNTCKTKKKIDLGMHSCAKPLSIMWEGSGGYLQNCKSIHAKLKKIDLPMRSCAPCS